MAEFEVRAGERTKVFSRFSSSLVQTITIDVVSVDGRPVSGTLEVQGSKWLFDKPAEVRPLQATQQVKKGYWDTRYAIYVTSDRDATVTVPRPRLGAPREDRA
jgi:hypothetical protein